MPDDVKQTRLAKLERLRDEKFDGSGARLAAAIKRSSSQVSQWFTAVRTVSEESARHIEDALDLPRGWMDRPSSSDAPSPDDTVHPVIREGYPERISDPQREDAPLSFREHHDGLAHSMSLEPGQMWIPRSEGIYPRMGRGGMDDGHEVVSLVRISIEGFRRQLGAARITQLGALRLVTAFGDSMRPTFDDGDMLVVDTGVQTIGQDGVYVLRGPDDILVKRVQRKSDGAWLLISSNKEYETERIAPAQREEFAVVGRVVFAWRGGIV